MIRFTKSLALLPLLAATLTLMSCQKDDQASPASPFEGQWKVLKHNPANNYILRIYPNAKKTGQLSIDNFGGYLNAPVTAQVQGQQMVIPEQTFSDGKGHKLVLTGHASLVSDTLRLHYEDHGSYGFVTDAQAVRVK